MSDPVKPAAGQVWGWSDGWKGSGPFVLTEPINETDWWCWCLADPRRTRIGFLDVSAGYNVRKTFLRWATADERRAAGLDPAEVLPRPEWVRVTASFRGVGAPEVRRVKRWEGEWPVVDCYSGGVRVGSLTLTSNWKWEPCDPPAPTPSDLASVRAERDAALAQVEALRIGVAAAEREVAVYRREFNVGDLRHEIAGLKKQRDEATKRAEAAEAKVATLRGDMTLGSIFTLTNPPKHDDLFWWCGRRFKIQAMDCLDAPKPTPAPAPCVDELRLTREDRAWMDAAQRRDAYYDGSPLCRDTSKAAIAARAAKAKGGGA